MVKTVKQSKSRMNGSAELTKALMRCAGTGIYIVQDGKFQYVNSLFQEMAGYTEQELLGVYSLDLVHPDDRESVREKAIESLKGQSLLPYEYRFMKKDGGVIWVLERLTSTDYKGKRAAAGSFMDITERKQTEEALRESESRLKLAIEALESGIWELNVKTGKAWRSLRHDQIFGYTTLLPEWTYQMFLDHVIPEDRSEVDSKYAYALSTKTKWDFECRIRRVDKTVRWIWAHGNPSEYDDKNEVVMLTGIVRDITERKQSEETLAKAEERYRTIMDEMHDDYFEVDLSGNYTFVNDAFCRSVGYAAEELIGMNFGATVASDEDKRIYKAFRQVYLTGQPTKAITFRFVRKDSSFGVGELVSFPARNEDGNIIGFRGVSHDVTERVRMEEALRRSEEKYRSILETIEESYYEVDLAGNFTLFNETLRRGFGYSREELMGMNYKVYTPPEIVKEVFQAYNQVYSTGEPIKWFPMEQIRKDGTRLVVENSVLPIRNEKGEIIGFRGVGRDITERLRMEEALRQSEEKYRTILEEIEEGYYEIDRAGNIIFVNKAACRQFGRSEEELIGTNYRAYVPKEDVKSVYKAWNKVYRTCEPLKSYPFVTVTKDGKQTFLENSISPLRNKEGKIIGFRAVSRDVTEHKQYEQKLAEMATHDSLTGLPNRTLLSDRLAMGLALSRRSGNRLAVMMLDLDRFKVINDTMGHGVGDQLLKAVAERLAGVTRKSDTIARIGGDEFVLVLPQVSQPTNAAKLAQRILDGFREPLVFDGHQLNITTSIGIAVYPDDGKDAEILLKNADTAMYRAKEQGRDAYRFYAGDEARAYDKEQISV